MKKLLVLLLVVSLFGCQKSTSSKLKDLGYVEEDIELICTFPEEIQERFLSSYNGVCVELMNTNGFDINNLDLYIKNYGKFENEKLVRIINENMDNKGRY